MDWDLALQGLLWGLISAVSLPLGALIGVWAWPSKKVTAALMAFGGGALLFALTIELFGHALHAKDGAHGGVDLQGIALVMMAAAVVGGLSFQLLNYVLEGQGAFHRKRALLRKHIIKEKRKDALTLLESLSKVALLRALPPDEVIQLIPSVERARFEPGAVVFHRGDTGHHVYFIESGEVQILLDADSPESDREIAMLGPKDVFGEIALISDVARTATAKTRTATSVLQIPRAAFENAMAHSPALQAAAQELVASRLDQLCEVDPDRAAHAKQWARTARRNLARIPLEATALDLKEAADQQGGHAALAIWLGIGLDAIPESLVIGMLVAASAASGSAMSLAFIAGVFLANLPEAMSSAVTMAHGGMRISRIMWMWISLCLLTGLGALIGTVILPAHPEGALVYVVYGIEGLAAGAMLTMIAETMLPEAFDQGGSGIVGLSTLAGFLAAMAVKVLA